MTIKLVGLVKLIEKLKEDIAPIYDKFSKIILKYPPQNVTFAQDFIFSMIPVTVNKYTTMIISLREIEELLRILGCPRVYSSDLFQLINNLDNPAVNTSKDSFIDNIKKIEEFFEKIENTLKKIVDRFDEEQIIRLDEALTNYFEECYFSCIVMSVSCVELELAKILKKNEKIQSKYKEEYKGKIPTFGALIEFFFKNIDDDIFKEYKWLKEFRPLLDICNQYRIFSAHAKGKQINNRIATSILNLSFEFLLKVPKL